MRSLWVLAVLAACHGNDAPTPAPAKTVARAIQDAAPVDLKHCDKPNVDIDLGSNGVSVGSAHLDGDLDKDWLETTLRSYTGSGCTPYVVIHAGLGVRYQDMVTAMDMSVKAGLPNVTVEGQGSAQQHPAAQRPAEKAPIVIVSTTEITFGGKSLGATDQPATMVALAKVLPATSDGVMIIQADKDTDSSVINRLVETLAAHGFDNVLFAVKT
jgi:biopolymer transport protein ExbD